MRTPSLSELLDQVKLPGICLPSFGDLGEAFDDLFPNVEETTRLEALSFHGLLSAHNATTVLDCTCGTGLQVIGLAKLGYDTAASDLSSRMLSVLRQKEQELGLHIDTKRADVRTLHPWQGRQFEAVISGGNSLAVLSTRADLVKSFHAMRSVATTGGLILVGGRDYGIAKTADEAIVPRYFRLNAGEPEWLLDLRLFGAERVRVINVFLRASQGRWRLKTFLKSYMYISAYLIADLMGEVGLTNVRLYDQTALHPYDGQPWYIVSGDC